MLGRNITARVASLRRVDWQSLSINFVMVFSPNTFSGAPHTHIATLTLPDGGTAAKEGEVLRTAAKSYPMVTAVPVKEALDAIAKTSATCCWRSAAPARSRYCQRRWCWAARSPPATATVFMTRLS